MIRHLKTDCMRWLFVIYFFSGVIITSYAQTLPASRSVDWTLAGLRDTTTNGFAEIEMQARGAVGDGATPNDAILAEVLSSIPAPGAILKFPDGNFLFNNTINLPSNVIIRGAGADNTTFTMNLGGTGHAFNIQGVPDNTNTTTLMESALKDSYSLVVDYAVHFSRGDWIQIIMEDAHLVTSAWAAHTVGQIVSIDEVVDNSIRLASPLRMNFDLTHLPYIRRIDPIQNTGIECLKIERTDNTAPQQSSNIQFSYATNCWVMGIESHNCTFSHIEAEHCSNIHVSKSYIHHAFDYGSGGRAYGVMLHFTTNECLVENNVFEHLRHAMILQAGANGNVFAYNYSFDPYWHTSDPWLSADAAGDMVLHGNHPYSNLFEQNICQNIVIDDSHGPNGPHNTFFRNKAERYGIYFSASNSPNQNFLGNEIPNTNFPYSLVNYSIKGTGHFIYGTNNKGAIDPPGTEMLPDLSYTYLNQPDFIPLEQWAAIGTPNIMGAATIPSLERYNSGDIFSNACGSITTATKHLSGTDEDILIFPNPIKSQVTIESKVFIKNLTIINELGQVLYTQDNIGMSGQIDTKTWATGVYFMLINTDDNQFSVKKTAKIR
ncbi:T9SS C-terminal target domain-containing protein [Marinilabiliaceae bacterium JC017]|nr:T9SS C-terminal target domain-containing protein [Marinilabiliaceae bacterium JC017]